MHEQLAEAVLEGPWHPGAPRDRLHAARLLACAGGREWTCRRRAPCRRRPSFDQALELPVNAHSETATLKAVRAEGGFGEYDRLVLHHGQTALAFELSRRRAVSAAELRLAGDLLDDLESPPRRPRDRRAGSPPSASSPSGRTRHSSPPLKTGMSPASNSAERRRGARPALRQLPLDRAAGAGGVSRRGCERGRGPCARAEDRRRRGPGARRDRPPVTRPRTGTEPARGAGRARRCLLAGRVLPRPRVARAPPVPPGCCARGIRRPCARSHRRQRLADELPDGPARYWVLLERRGRANRRPSPYASLPHGPAPGADRPAPGRSGRAHGALARGQGESGADCAAGGNGA